MTVAALSIDGKEHLESLQKMSRFEKGEQKKKLLARQVKNKSESQYLKNWPYPATYRIPQQNKPKGWRVGPGVKSTLLFPGTDPSSVARTHVQWLTTTYNLTPILGFPTPSSGVHRHPSTHTYTHKHTINR